MRFVRAAIFLLVGCGLAGCEDGTSVPATASSRPDIVLITIDTLRADHLGVYGYARDTSPAIDRFAAEGLVFEHAFSHAPSTRLSVASLMTGFLPHETQVIRSVPLPLGVDTIAEQLGRVGYSTAAVVGNYVLRRENGYSQGFAIFDDTLESREEGRGWSERVARRTTERAIEVVDALESRPFFLWVHYQDPHGPYRPADGSIGRFVDSSLPPHPLDVNRDLSGRGGIPKHHALDDERDLHHYVAAYDAEIYYADLHVGRLLDALRERGLYDDAFVALTSDHGEGMGEHNFYFSHVGQLYHSLLRIPLIVRYGGRVGRRGDWVQHIDLLPTLQRLAGLPIDPRLRGHDLLDPDAPTREIVAETLSPIEGDGRKISITRDGWKLIVSRQPMRVALFDLVGDPEELDDLADDPEHADRMRDMRTRLRELRKDIRLSLESVAPQELSDEERAELEALGYVR